MRTVLLILAVVFFQSSRAQSPGSRRPSLQNSVDDQSQLAKGENADEKIKKNFFLKAEVSRTTCYVGEAVMATFKAYSRLNANSRVIRRPAMTGFSVMEMVDAYSNDPKVEVVDGKAFNTHLIRKVQLFPLQEGKYSLEPAQVESQIFLRNPNTVKYLTLETPPIDITVKPLPARNQPDSFSGAVGQFTVSLKMDDRDLDQFDPAVAKLTISGEGNFPVITDPDISWPKGLDVSTPIVREELNKYVFPLSGSKIFEYPLDTGKPGDYTISPITFSYFDPASAKYKSVFTEAIHFTIKKGARKKNIAEQFVTHARETPLQYYYFGLIGLIIVGWILYQIFRKNTKT